MNQNFKERFSLDFLNVAPKAEDQKNMATPVPLAPFNTPPLPPGLQSVVDGLSGQLLTIMQKNPNQTSTVLELVKSSSLRIDIVLPVIQYLLGKGIVQRVAEDSAGNDSFRVTPGENNI